MPRKSKPRKPKLEKMAIMRGKIVTVHRDEHGGKYFLKRGKRVYIVG